MRQERLRYWQACFLLVIVAWLYAGNGCAQIRYARWMIQAGAGPSIDGEWIMSGALHWNGYHHFGMRVEVRDWKYLSRATPSDYQPGLCAWGDCAPRDHIWSYAALVSKRWSLKSYWLEAGVEAGPSVLMRRELHFRPNESGGTGESNYLQKAHTALGAAACLRSHVDWYPTRYWGCSLGMNTLFDKQVRVAFELAMQFGYSRFKGRR